VKLGEDLLVVGESPGLVLRENEILVHHHIKDPVFSPYELCLYPTLLFDCGRQTGGPGQIVSLDAVGNRNLHVAPFPSLDGFLAKAFRLVPYPGLSWAVLYQGVIHPLQDAEKDPVFRLLKNGQIQAPEMPRSETYMAVRRSDAG